MGMQASKGRRVIHGWSLRWDEARAAEARAQGVWPDETAGDVALRAAAADPGRVIVVDEQRSLTVGELAAEAQALARVFIARGLKPGDVISIMLPNWHEATIIYLAATFAGLVSNLILPNYRNNEVTFTLDDCGSRMIFIPEIFRKFDYVEMMQAVNAGLRKPVEVVVLRGDARGATEYAALLAERHADVTLPLVDPDSVKMVMYTSGTSGRAKGVLHSHNSIAAAVTQIHRYWHVEAGDCFFVPSPISHIGGSLYAFELPLLAGTKVVLQEAWDPDAAVAAFEAHGCTHMAGATPFLQALLASALRAGTRLPRLKVFICGGASVPASLIREAAAQFENCIVSRVFGCTEVPMITAGSMAPGDITHAAETDGKPGLCTVKLIGADGQPAVGEGEILAIGPQMLLGYLRAEDEEGRFDGAGYFITGDLAKLVDGEYLVITGRAKDIIIRNGENIAPKEIEDMLILHPAIADVSIVGLPDARTGELACAVIVPRPGQTPGVNDLRDFLNARNVAKFKIPERVELRDSLPRNAAGKVLKNVLRDLVLSSTPAVAER
jgi:acyl-CoA synthetase (AMP-forming)/AMP-acid ligase II